MSVRAHRARRRAATALVLTALTALTLTGCRDGEGIRDEGPAKSRSAEQPSAGQHTQETARSMNRTASGH
ncbi:hypothetical protein [Streptomyces pseudovenezuelae]|uniref:Uncharacterized protein n=1 Tax=Streptomyces pseudovenezuelae TaxID=67350 RepID=A0ABT6M229_9ACTN|nr:hypothetical protein [Streptomyces pseudovenezuelae]MDH6222617.1 hypothetical protein [Streptomyces pseudovenezuelae]